MFRTEKRNTCITNVLSILLHFIILATQEKRPILTFKNVGHWVCKNSSTAVKDYKSITMGYKK